MKSWLPHSVSRSWWRTAPALKEPSAFRPRRRQRPTGIPSCTTNVSNLCLAPNLADNLPCDAQRDFVPVTQLGLTVLAMVVPTSLNVKTLKDFTEYAKANPRKTSFASFGNGSTSHVYGEMLKAAAGIEMTHVPYKGAGPAVQDIMAGHATTGIHDLGSVGPHIASRRIVALAVTGPKRWPLLPDVPTFAELGYALLRAGAR